MSASPFTHVPLFIMDELDKFVGNNCRMSPLPEITMNFQPIFVPASLAKFFLIATCFGVGFVFPHQSYSQALTPQLSNAIESVRMGRATPGQKALMFQNNNVINAARLGGWIPDSSYQAAQNNYASINQSIAKTAAEKAGASFEVQKSTSSRYSPGTDSDYIVQAKSKDPVGQISRMQENYNQGVNAYLKEALEAEGMNFQGRKDWHNRLDVDFMADPKHVTDEQFRKIAELNNDAYKRRGAAEFERTSRAGGGTKVTPGQFSDYAQEMQDFVKKKQKTMAQVRSNPALLKNTDVMDEYHRLMAQEQKYISRIEAAKDLLRKQEGLKSTKVPQGPPYYEMRVNKNGTATLRKRSHGTVASRGAQRSFDGRTETINASLLAENSMNRAVGELADSMAEAAKKNPGKWPNAASQIAELTDGMPPAQKGRLIEKIRFDHGNDVAKSVANKMRERVRATRPGRFQQLDNSLKNALNVTDDLSELRGIRRSLNEGAAGVLGKLDAFESLGTVVELKEAVDSARTYVQSLKKAMDPNLTDEEADEFFRKAEQASWTMAKNGTLGALTEAVPTFGAMYAGWSLGFDGTRYVLENTETGRMIDRKAEDFFDRHQRAAGRAFDGLTEFLGGDSEKMKGEDRMRELEATYWRALREGRIRLKPGFRTLDIAERIRVGDLSGIRDLIEPGPNASQLTVDRIAGQAPAAIDRTPPTNPKGPSHGEDPTLIQVPQSFELGANGSMEERLRALERQGQSAFGKPQRSDESGLSMQDSTTTDYRKRAQQLATGRGTQSNPQPGDYRNRAQQINEVVTAREAQQEQMRQEQIRQAQNRQAQILEQQRQQQIFEQRLAEWKRQQAIAQWTAEQHRRAAIAEQQRRLAQQQQRQQQQQPASPNLGWPDTSHMLPAPRHKSIDEVMRGSNNQEFHKLDDTPGGGG